MPFPRVALNHEILPRKFRPHLLFLAFSASPRIVARAGTHPRNDEIVMIHCPLPGATEAGLQPWHSLIPARRPPSVAPRRFPLAVTVTRDHSSPNVSWLQGSGSLGVADTMMVTAFLQAFDVHLRAQRLVPGELGETIFLHSPYPRVPERPPARCLSMYGARGCHHVLEEPRTFVGAAASVSCAKPMARNLTP